MGSVQCYTNMMLQDGIIETKSWHFPTGSLEVTGLRPTTAMTFVLEANQCRMVATRTDEGGNIEVANGGWQGGIK